MCSRVLVENYMCLLQPFLAQVFFRLFFRLFFPALLEKSKGQNPWDKGSLWQKG